MDQASLAKTQSMLDLEYIEEVKDSNQCPQAENEPLVIILVGLPARGKSYISKRISTYLNWMGISTKVFNVGAYRRTLIGSHLPHEFFDPNNERGVQARWQMCVHTCDELIKWLRKGGKVGIYDGTNTTRERREYLLNRCIDAGVPKDRVIFVESICSDEKVIKKNVLASKLNMPDYSGMDPDKAVEDFLARIQHYADTYEPMGRKDFKSISKVHSSVQIKEDADDGTANTGNTPTDECSPTTSKAANSYDDDEDEEEYDTDKSYMQFIDVGRKVEVNNIRGYLPSRICYLIMNTHIVPRRIWLSRHGESMFNVDDRIGGDSPLSPRGEKYADVLAQFVEENVVKQSSKLFVWTSTMQRTIQTARKLPKQFPVIRWKALDEINAGECDGMTYDEVREKLPSEAEKRLMNKFRYRYPRGESYEDLVQRLDPVIIEIERQKTPLLIVAHQAILRVLYGYLTGRAPKDCPTIDMPLHEIVELTPSAYGVTEKRYNLNDRVQL